MRFVVLRTVWNRAVFEQFPQDFGVALLDGSI